MTDERLMNMAMISTESDTAKSVRYDWVDKNICIFENLESHFPSLNRAIG